MGYNMSVVGNKKLTALGDSAGSSLRNSRNLRQHSHEARPERALLEKLAEKQPLRRLPGKQPSRADESGERNTRFKSLRIHTEKFSPGRRAAAERSRTMAVRAEEEERPERFPFLTKFEREEAARYEVHFIGGRRIHSLRDFTSSSCEARVAPGDAIAYRYEVLSLLGQGSFGQVFKSFDHRKRELVALKVIRNEAKFNRQAKVEMRILETVAMRDPRGKSNIVQLKHGFFFRGHACLVFELLHINLYELSRELKFKGLGADMIRRVAIQVLQGLLFLRRQDIIHCDLKPENILLKQEGKTGVKIIDLGSGCFQPEQIYTYIQSRFYRAPEIILGLTYSPAIDAWSMGCILAELFLGYPLFPGENEQEQMLMFMELLGVPPDALIHLGSRSHKFFDGVLVRLRPNSKGKIRRPASKSLEAVLACEDADFVEFVKRFLVWEPEGRLTPEEALMDPWVLKGLPPEIRKQHVAAVGRESFS